MEEETNEQQNEEIEIIEEDSRVDDKVRKLKKDIATCKLEKEEYLKGWQRAKADYINFYRESTERQARAAEYSEESIFRELLDLADSFELAYAAGAPDSQWARGIRQTYDKLKNIMKAHEIREIESTGKKFDPAIHEAIELVEIEDQDKDDLVVAEIQKGYMLKGRVLRPSRVRVAHYKIKE